MLSAGDEFQAMLACSGRTSERDVSESLYHVVLGMPAEGSFLMALGSPRPCSVASGKRQEGEKFKQN